MREPRIRFLPNFPENPGNAARCEVATGEIEVNKAMWDVLPNYQREYVLAHEKGHYYRQTFDEIDADQYALEQLALKRKNSLWHYVLSVRNISHNDRQRVRAAEKNALEIAAREGSAEAQQLLLEYYANAQGQTTQEKSMFGTVGVDVEWKMKWFVFAWILLITVTTSIIIAKKQ